MRIQKLTSYLPFICRFKNFTVEREDGLFVLQTICWPILDFQTNKQCAGSLPDAVLYSPAAQHWRTAKGEDEKKRNRKEKVSTCESVLVDVLLE